ncbi:rolling circle replication-associated protein [Clostridioides difficile]|uniref:rolling circle replication-associated protein n=1 Tax=Clostridioides difficile TaxID=1496 RepID=UPI000BB1D2D2|nr:hypothetical protein [Clostridioides difficile]
MEIYRPKENIRPKLYDTVRVKEMGNIIELMYSEFKNNKIVIKKINANEYIDTRTGEIKEFNHISDRSQLKSEVRASLRRLRDYLNTNITDVSHCKWITLTYSENMTDTKRLYDDFVKFNKRLKYNITNAFALTYEYIVAMEPQGRGAWHCHMAMIFETDAPFIPNSKMSELWKQGFTVTKKLDDVDNVGAYLTAYLGDISLDEVQDMLDDNKVSAGFVLNNFVGKEVRDVEVDGVKKSILKGARLCMYPPKFNLYRCSKGIKKPNIDYKYEFEAQKKIRDGTLTFEKTLKITDSDSDFKNIINYRYYNLKKENSL